MFFQYWGEGCSLPFFLPQCSCGRTLSSWRCFFFFFCAFEGRHHHTTIPTHLFPPPPLFYSFRNFLKRKMPLLIQRRHLFVGHSVFSGSTLFFFFFLCICILMRERNCLNKKKISTTRCVRVCRVRPQGEKNEIYIYRGRAATAARGASASSVRRVFFQFLPCFLFTCS